MFENPRWRRRPSQKSRYFRNGLTDLDEIWCVHAKWVSLPLRPLKSLNFKKVYMVDGRHFEYR